MREDNYHHIKQILADAQSFVESNWKDGIGVQTGQFIEQVKRNLDKEDRRKNEFLALSEEINKVCQAILNDEDEPKRLVLKLKR